jgi:hypothetical protein
MSPNDKNQFEESLMDKKKTSTSDVVFRWLGWLIVIGFVASILWSMWVDTLQPLIRAGDVQALIYNLVGLPIILLGTGIFVYGGVRFVRATLNAMAEPHTLDNYARIQAGNMLPDDLRQARMENLKALWNAWKVPLFWLALGFALIALGGFLINL